MQHNKLKVETTARSPEKLHELTNTTTVTTAVQIVHDLIVIVNTICKYIIHIL